MIHYDTSLFQWRIKRGCKGAYAPSIIGNVIYNNEILDEYN